jgi:hypothetical protein
LNGSNWESRRTASGPEAEVRDLKLPSRKVPLESAATLHCIPSPASASSARRGAIYDKTTGPVGVAAPSIEGDSAMCKRASQDLKVPPNRADHVRGHQEERRIPIQRNEHRVRGRNQCSSGRSSRFAAYVAKGGCLKTAKAGRGVS